MGLRPRFEASPRPRQQREETAEKGSRLFTINGVDLLILDTQYTPNEYAQRVGWGDRLANPNST